MKNDKRAGLEEMVKREVDAMGDVEVEQVADYLAGKRIAVCVTGGIAAIEAPKVIRQLRRYGADVNVILSEKAREYFGTVMFEWASGKEAVAQLTGRAEHICTEDAALVLPATLNTIGEIVNGEAHGVVTTYLASAIGRGIPVTIVPAMHKSMYDNPFFQKNLGELSKLENIIIMKPRLREGKAKLADKAEIVAQVTRSASTDSLKGRSVLITTGPTRGYIDPVRFVTNMSSGQLGLDIANDLYLRGADIKVVLGPGKAMPQSYLDVVNVKTPDEMLEACLNELRRKDYDIAIFAAAVSDYIPDQTAERKLKSGKELVVSFKPTKKIIREVDLVKRKDRNKLFKVGFKLETADSDEELISRGYDALLNNRCHLVVANNLKDIGPEKHRAFLITPERGYTSIDSKSGIVSALAHELGVRVNSTFYTTVFSGKEHDTSSLVERMQKAGQTLWDAGVLPKYREGTYGNFSVKTGDGFVITGRGIDKGNIKAYDLVFVEGVDHEKREKYISGNVKSSTDTVAHHMVYEAFPDVWAIVHVHDELVLKNADRLGVAVTTQDYPCGTYELGKEIVSALRKGADGYVALKNHGVLAVGRDIEEASSKIIACRAKAEGLK